MRVMYVLYSLLAGMPATPQNMSVVDKFITAEACTAERDKLRETLDDVEFNCARIEVLP